MHVALQSPLAPTALAARFAAVRARSLALAAPLSPEDAMVQSMADTSPAKWHLAHGTWFFETFVLGAREGHAPFNADWAVLFNSYYQSVGPMHARPHRGLLSRPSLGEVRAYRHAIDARMHDAFARGDFDIDVLQRIELGLHHEQQHQELLLTDIKHAFWCNPLRPAYRDAPIPPSQALERRWIEHGEAVIEIGAPAWPTDSNAFAFDNESPRHRVLVPAHAISTTLVTNAEVQAFIDDGGYATPALWLSAGWAQVQADAWRAPLYWDVDSATHFTLHGTQPIDPHAPACHISYFEADAIARWAGARLPTEAEWEQAARGDRIGHDEPRALHPRVDADDDAMHGLFDAVWQWTSTAYTPYPRFAPMPGALGEYNGKFMCGQWVLRGSSFATPPAHARPTYRNFFHPPDRWQFSGLRLARDTA